MFIYLNKRRGQSTAEYAVVLGLIAAAVMAMQTYVKRGLQGRIAEATDAVGGQFEPKYLLAESKTKHESEQTEEMKTGGAVGKDFLKNKQHREGYQTITNTK